MLFDCDLENWSCLSRSVEGDMLVCKVSTVKLTPCNLPCMFSFPEQQLVIECKHGLDYPISDHIHSNISAM